MDCHPLAEMERGWWPKVHDEYLASRFSKGRSMLVRHGRFLLAGILVLGVVLRVAYILALPNVQAEPDEADYLTSAASLADQGSFESTVYYHVPPVVPLAFAGLFVFTGPSLLAARLLQAVLFGATGSLLFLLGTEVGGRRVGLLAAAAAAIYPYFIFFSAQVLTESIATTTISAMILAAVLAVKRESPLWAVAFGASIAVATLTRASVFYFVLAVPLVYLIAWGVRRARWLMATALTLGAFALVYLPWTFVNLHYFGSYFIQPTIGSGVLLYQTALRITMPDEAARRTFLRSEVLPKYYNPTGATHAERLRGDIYLRQEGERILRENRGALPRIAWRNFQRFWQFYPNAPAGAGRGRAHLFKLLGIGSYGILFPFFVVGAIRCLQQFRMLSVLYGFIAYFTIVHTMLYGQLRYRVPMDGLVLVLAVAGLVFVVDYLRERWFSSGLEEPGVVARGGLL